MAGRAHLAPRVARSYRPRTASIAHRFASFTAGLEVIDPRAHCVGAGKTTSSDQEGFQMAGTYSVVNARTRFTARDYDRINGQFQRFHALSMAPRYIAHAPSVE